MLDSIRLVSNKAAGFDKRGIDFDKKGSRSGAPAHGTYAIQ
jgi:hypothetical protein